MGPFLDRFSIRDLENFSGIKAHTIRIWEKRYHLLDPVRTGTNIRTYSADELKTILNVAFLNRQGVKISHIAELSRSERERRVQQLAEDRKVPEAALNTLKIAMLTYDTALFERVSDDFRMREGFRALVERVYMPLLEQAGLLWQSNSICPAQEHFLSNLIRQKLIAAIDPVRPLNSPHSRLHVLFLPENEIHEIGLLYLHYRLRVAGEHTLYLGQSVPMEDLVELARQFPGPITFLGVLTVFPASEDLPAFVEKLRQVMPEERISFVLAGARVAAAAPQAPVPGLRLVPRLRDLLGEMP